MAIIPVPTKFSFTRVGRFALQRATNVLRSRYTGQGQRIVYPYAVWQLQATLVDYDGPEAAAIRSFLAQLEGQKHTFRLPVPGYTKPATGVAYDVALHSPGAARASSIVITNANFSVPLLADGDFFTIQDELKIVTGAVATNATGQATISFKPPLRKAAVTGTLVKLQNPTVMLHAAEDDVASWGLTAPIRHNFDFNAIEAVEI